MALTGGLLTVTLGVLALERLDGWRMGLLHGDCKYLPENTVTILASFLQGNPPGPDQKIIYT